MRKRVFIFLLIMASLIPSNGENSEPVDINDSTSLVETIIQNTPETTVCETETQETQADTVSIKSSYDCDEPKITVFFRKPAASLEQDSVSGLRVEDSSMTDKEPTTENQDLVSIGTFVLTAYCSCRRCCGKYAEGRPVDQYGNEIVQGAIGVRLTAGISIAVDPRVIPYMSRVLINGRTYIAHDTGASIKGNRIDIYFDDHQEASLFGTQFAEVFLYT